MRALYCSFIMEKYNTDISMHKYITSLVFFLFALSFGHVCAAQHRPEIYVVTFRADWCGPCKILEPNLARALNALHDPSIKPLIIDITNGPRSESSAYIAFDHAIVSQYNQWYGVTGFAAIIDADSKRTLGCVNMTYDAASIEMHIRNLKAYAVRNQPIFDLTCPAPSGARG